MPINPKKERTKARWVFLVSFYIVQLVAITGGLLTHYALRDLSIIFLLLEMLCTLLISGLLIQKSFALRARIRQRDPEDIVGQKSVLYIGLSGISLILLIVSFALHEVLSKSDVKEFITVALGWFFAAAFAIIFYLGYIMPEWLKKRWNAQYAKKKIRASDSLAVTR